MDIIPQFAKEASHKFTKEAIHEFAEISQKKRKDIILEFTEGREGMICSENETRVRGCASM